MKSVKSIISVSVVVVLAFLVWHYAIRPSDMPSQNSTAAQASSKENLSSSTADVVFPVSVSIARRGSFAKKTTTNGILRAKREVELVARIAGEIRSANAFNGKFVTKGDLLIKLDDRENRLALEKAASGLLSAQIEYRTLTSSSFYGSTDSQRTSIELDSLKSTFALIDSAYRQHKIDDQDYLRARREYDASYAYLRANRGDVVASKTGLVQAKEAHERAKMNLEWTEIRAPFSGYVADFDLVAGKQVQAGNVLCKIVDVSSLLVDIEVVESEVAKLEVGQKAELTVTALPDKRFAGIVRTLNPIIDEKTKTMKATIELQRSRGAEFRKTEKREKGPAERDSEKRKKSEKEKLTPGMYATVRIETETFNNRLIVPKAALLVRDQRTLVFVVNGDLAKWHYVDVGEENDEVLEIRDGIAVGDTVIVDGHYTLAHDAKVKIVK